MDWDTLQSSIDLLLASRKPETTLSFYGGEPLLQFDLIRRAVAYVRSKRRKRPRIRYSTITNGTLLRDEVIDFLADHEFHLRISFDGIPAMQDVRGPGTFRILDGALDRLKERHPRYFARSVNVNVTVMSTTIRHVADSFEYLLSKDLREIHISPLDTNDAGWRAASKDELDGQFERIFKIARAHHRRTGRIPLVLLRRDGPEDVHAPRGRAMCGVAEGHSLTVDVDGGVHGCGTFVPSFQTFPSEFLASRLEGMQMGPVTAKELPERLAMYPAAAHAAGIFDNKQDKYSSYGHCASCRYMSTCAVCPVSIGHIPGNTDPNRVPDHLCAFNLITGKWRDRFPVQSAPGDVLLGRAPLPAVMRKLRRAALSRSR